MIHITFRFNYIFITSTKYPIIRHMLKIILEMNDSNQTIIQLFSSLPPNVLQFQISAKRQQKSVILNGFLLTILIPSRKFPTIGDMQKIQLEMNDFNHSSVPQFSPIERYVLHFEIYRKSHFKCIVLRNVPFKYLHHFEEMPHTWTFLENHLRNQ
jgi:hypothetical protein